VMKCSKCGSEQHFIRFCPQNTEASKPSGKGSGNGYVTVEHWSRQPGANPAIGGAYFGDVVPEFIPSIRYEDGTTEALATTEQNAQRLSVFLHSAAAGPASTGQTTEIRSPVEQKDLTAAQQRLWQFPWFQECYHTQVRLATGQEGLLVDCGAMGNLCGDQWAKRVADLAMQAGQATTYRTIPEVKIEGVGNGHSKIVQSASIPTCLADGTIGNYETMVQANSELPGLWGLVSQTKGQVIIDCGNDRVIYPGPGGVQYNLSPGSKVVKCQRAISGHLLMPCAEWQNAKPGSTSKVGTRL
jgi:hypothetical protein